MKKRAAFLIGAGCLLLSASLTLVVNNQLESAGAEKSAAALSEAFLTRSVYYETPVTERAGTLRESTPEMDETRSAVEHASVKQPIVIDGQQYIGLLSIPSLGLNLPVNDDISYPLLKATPCRYYGSEETGSLIIAAHNYNGHFGRIGSLKPGDRVDFTGADGIAESYAVSEVQTLANNAVDEMIKPGDWDLTLFTCTYSGADRITVRCVKEAGA